MGYNQHDAHELLIGWRMIVLFSYLIMFTFFCYLIMIVLFSYRIMFTLFSYLIMITFFSYFIKTQGRIQSKISEGVQNFQEGCTFSTHKVVILQ